MQDVTSSKAGLKNARAEKDKRVKAAKAVADTDKKAQEGAKSAKAK